MAVARKFEETRLYLLDLSTASTETLVMLGILKENADEARLAFRKRFGTHPGVSSLTPWYLRLVGFHD